MTFAERQAIADALENIKALQSRVAELEHGLVNTVKVLQQYEAQIAILEAQRPTLTMKGRANG